MPQLLTCPCGAAEGESHHERCVETCIKEGADPVELFHLREGGNSGLWLEGRDEKECRGQDSKYN